MADWFKSRKSQTPSLLSIPSFDHTPASPYESGTSTFESAEQHEPRTRPQSAMRVLSFMKSSPSITSPSFPGSPDFDWERLQDSAADAVWYEPNSDQIAEGLKVVMMTRGNFEPVPIEYNSNILHVLEVYWHQCEELKQKDLEIEKLKAKLTDQMDQIELLGKEWGVKEGQYKTELKKLEVMVANGVGGIEAVILGRSKSVLDRTSTPIEARIQKIREGSGSSSSAGQEPRRRMNRLAGSGSAKEENEIRLSKAFSQKRRPRPENHLSDHFRPKNEYAEAEVVYAERLDPSQEPELQPQEDAVYSSSSSSDDDEYTTTRSSVSDNKPLPKIPEERPSRLASIEELPTKTHISKTLEAQNRHFSYVPGDDSLQWQGQRPRVVSRKSLEREETNQDAPDTLFSSEHPEDIGLSTFHQIPHSTSSGSFTSANQSQVLARHLSQWGPEKIKRGDSNSSQVTAIRDKSARSSMELGSGSGDVTKQTAATSNAAIAAARAMSERKS